MLKYLVMRINYLKPLIVFKDNEHFLCFQGLLMTSKIKLTILCFRPRSHVREFRKHMTQ